MRQQFIVVLIVTAASIPIAVGAEKPEGKKPAIRPRLSESVLTLGDKIFKPVRVYPAWHYQHPAGKLRVAVQDQTITALDAQTNKPAWTAKSEDGRSLEWLAADEEIAFLRTGGHEEQGKSPRFGRPARVRRLRLDTGKWLKPLDVPSEKPKEKAADVVVAVRPYPQGLVVLSATVLDDSASHEDGNLQSYRVTGFQRGKDAVAWSRSYRSAGQRGYSGGYLLAAHRPDYAAESIQQLTAMGSQVIVCAGPLDDLVCLNPLSGKEAWRVPRIWEFRRGFIGPSVWTHYIGRYGYEENDLKLAAEGPGKDGFADLEYLKQLREEIKKAKARVEQDDYAVVAGPQVVPAGKGWSGDLQHSIFVAVARSEKSAWAGYLADCTVYELNESGEPIGMVNLPRMVNGWQADVNEQGLVWACPRDAMVKLTPSSNRQTMGGQLGGHDMLCRVAWYCQPEPLPEPQAWLIAGPAGDPVAYSPTHAFRPAGGYILKRGEQIYHFPIRMFDLKSTQSQVLTLSVPFDGQVPKPETNYSGGDSQIHTFGPYLLGVTWLEVGGGILQIVLGTESGATAADFEITQVGGGKLQRK